MSTIDWIILAGTLAFIVLYGIWKSRGTQTMKSYLLADQQLPWYHVGLSVMATQASAITFLSAPGQAYSDGMRFIQFYFGLPLAMVVLCITFVPAFKRLNVYTAYEFLEQRFDNKTRTLTAFLFLLQRGLSTGITIYAPAIILSTILHVDLIYTIVFNGLIVIVYTVYGGTKAVSYTQLFQMLIIFAGLFLAAYMVVHLLPENVGFMDALHIAGKMDKLNAIDTSFDWNNKYNLWSGLIGGFFLQLSYFGTDQSQVGRYLTGNSVKESRWGLLMNGLVKIPMQFIILLIGTLVFSYYQFHTPPVFFNPTEVEKVRQSSYADAFNNAEKEFNYLHEQKKLEVEKLVLAVQSEDEAAIDIAKQNVHSVDEKASLAREKAVDLIVKNNDRADKNDSNYVFLTFVTNQLPVGIIGLLIAIIFLASMGSAASGLNSLASTTVVDFYKRLYHKDKESSSDVAVSRWSTVAWGLFCIAVAIFASKLGNLIEAVNILGSLFYGTILGVFLVAFYVKRVNGNQVFLAACITEAMVIVLWKYDVMAFLWLNVWGCLSVVALGLLFNLFQKKNPESINK
jgi:solute:Na+ symporter, SSS family